MTGTYFPIFSFFPFFTNGSYVSLFHPLGISLGCYDFSDGMQLGSFIHQCPQVLSCISSSPMDATGMTVWVLSTERAQVMVKTQKSTIIQRFWPTTCIRTSATKNMWKVLVISYWEPLKHPFTIWTINLSRDFSAFWSPAFIHKWAIKPGKTRGLQPIPTPSRKR